MKSTKSILNRIKKNMEKEQEDSYCRIGYWLVRDFDGQRFFISEKVDKQALEKICDKVLTDKTGSDYWIDYCYGLDVQGIPAWSNIDQIDQFI